MSADFVAWDDGINVYENSHIRGLDLDRLKWMFTDTQEALRYKPLSWLAWALIYGCSGLSPFGYHLGNLILHCLNVVLVFLLLEGLLIRHEKEQLGQKSFESIACAWGALVWAIHPLRVEPVAWVTGLPYNLSLTFLLGSFLLYLRSRTLSAPNENGILLYGGSIALFFLSGLSYPIGLAYPGALLALEIYLRHQNRENSAPGKRGHLILRTLPFFAIAAGLLAITLSGRLRAGGIWSKPGTIEQFGLIARVMQGFYVWAYYLWKHCFPFNLSLIYTRLVSFNTTDPAFVGSAALILATTFWLWLKRERWPGLLALWLSYLALLVPALGLTEHPHFTSDRYGMVVGILWVLVLTGGLIKLRDQHGRAPHLIAVAAAVVVCLSIMSIHQTAVWQNSVALFEHALRKNPEGAPYHTKLQRHLAAAYSSQHRFAQALDCYEKILDRFPADPMSHQNSAAILLELGRWKEAQAHYQVLLKTDPANAEYHNGLGIIFAAAGNWNAAVDEFETALHIDPQLQSGKRNLARALQNSR